MFHTVKMLHARAHYNAYKNHRQYHVSFKAVSITSLEHMKGLHCMVVFMCPHIKIRIF